MLKRKLWSKSEDEALMRLIQPDAANPQWEVVAEEMAVMGFAKTAKQCKDRWINNLSPALNKTKWSCSESKELLGQYLRNGNKWKVISGIFAGRTDNSVKNQFFSVIRKSLRTMNKFLGINCNTNVINSIRPKILAELLSSEPGNLARSSLVQRFSFMPFATLTRDTNDQERAAVKECVEYVIAQNESYITQKVKPRRIAKQNKSMTTNRTVSVVNSVVNVELASESSMVLEELVEVDVKISESKESVHAPNEKSQVVDIIGQQLQELAEHHNSLRSMAEHNNAQLRHVAIEFYDKMCNISACIKAELQAAGDDAQGAQLLAYVSAASKFLEYFRSDGSAVVRPNMDSHAQTNESFEHNILGSIHNLDARESLSVVENTSRKPTLIHAVRENQASMCFYDAQYREPTETYTAARTDLFCEQLEEIFDELSCHDSFL